MHAQRKLSLLALGLVLVARPAAGATDEVEVSFERRLERLVERLEKKRQETHIPGMAFAVVKDDPLMDGLDGEHFYFQHSFAFDCSDDYVITRAEYYRSFVCGIRCRHIAGVQFHPEKSAVSGTRLLAAFFRYS